MISIHKRHGKGNDLEVYYRLTYDFLISKVKKGDNLRVKNKKYKTCKNTKGKVKPKS